MASVKKNLFMQVDGPPRGNGKPKRTWTEVIKLGLKKCQVSEDLA